MSEHRPHQPGWLAVPRVPWLSPRIKLDRFWPLRFTLRELRECDALVDLIQQQVSVTCWAVASFNWRWDGQIGDDILEVTVVELEPREA